MPSDRFLPASFPAAKRALRSLAHLFLVGMVLLAWTGLLGADMIPSVPTFRPWAFNRIGSEFPRLTTENIILVVVLLTAFEGLCLFGLIAARKSYLSKHTIKNDGTAQGNP